MQQVTKLSWKTFLHYNFLLIFSAVLISTYADQYITKQVEYVISARTGLSNMIFFWGGLSILSSIIFPMVTTLICAFTLTKNSSQKFFLPSFFAEHFELNVIECLRAWGKTFLWGLLFILPAFRKYVDYVLTPYVVYFSKKYAAGEVDALEYSKHFAKKMWWPLNLWLSLFMLVIPVLKYAFLDDYTLFSDTPFKATGIVLGQSILELIFHYYILSRFFKFLAEAESVEVANAINV